MSIRLSLTACTLSGVVLASPASALTAPELWEDWQTAMTLLGQEVEVANKTYSGGVLRLEGITQRMPIDPAVGRNITFIDALVLTERPDDRVQIDIEGGYRIDFGGVSEGERSDGSLSLSFEGLDAFAQGAPGDILYDFGADLAEMSLDELAYNGEPVPVTFQLAATGVTSQTQQADAVYSGTGAVAALALTLTAEDAQDSGLEVNFGLTDLSFQGSADYAEFAAMGAGDPGAVFRSQTPTEMQVTHGPASFQVSTTAPGQSGAISGRADSGSFDGRFGQGRALYGTTVTGLNVDAQGMGLPAPVNVTIESLGYRIEGPMLASDTPQEFAASINVLGLAVPDTVWSMVDPGATLPRDPATLVLELSGLAQLDDDLTAPATPAMEAPGDLLALALERLELSFAGAEAKANGAFALDPDGPPMMPGMPAASGALRVEMQGVTTLLSSLTSLGLLDPSSAMGAQMMLGMFARPAPEGGDALISEIEVSPDGSITANGMRIR